MQFYIQPVGKLWCAFGNSAMIEYAEKTYERLIDTLLYYHPTAKIVRVR